MGFFCEKICPEPCHPRQVPRLKGRLTPERLREIFAGCVDFCSRPVAVGGALEGELIFLAGMVRMERVSDYILQPLARDESLGQKGVEEAWERIVNGALYNLTVFQRDQLDQGVDDLISGFCLLFLPGAGDRAISFLAGTEEKRAISAPADEISVKGSKDCFVENLRTNTSLVRRHLKCPELKIAEQIVGRQSLIPVDVLWLDGIARPERVAELQKRIGEIDIDALLAPGDLEAYVTEEQRTVFPLIQHTERPDRFCYGLTQGRIGVLAEGLPIGYLAPAVLGDFLQAPQDRSENWMVASALTVTRWLCFLLTLFLPAVYIAMVNFHPEMIPTRLALSILAARQDVPFSTLFEVLLLLAAFEILQEAGLRLPKSIGQTISILGGLVVGSAAVEAKLISPAVLVTVATAGIAGYTMPDQDLAGALRLWRFFLAVLAGIGGLFGTMIGTVLLVGHLAELESLGAPYLIPFAADGEGRGERLLHQPLPAEKLRPSHLRAANRRKQK